MGGNQPIKVNVRVVAATNRDLAQFTKGGKFREDLYYRLNVVGIEIPPLRERAEDINMLARNFISHSCRRLGFDPKEISPEAMKILMEYSWPGNVRELENTIEHTVVVQKGEIILPADLPASVLNGELGPMRTGGEWDELSNLPYKQAKAEALERFHRVYFNSLMLKSNGNLSKAARLAELDRSNFRRIMKSSGIKSESDQQSQDQIN